MLGFSTFHLLKLLDLLGKGLLAGVHVYYMEKTGSTLYGSLLTLHSIVYFLANAPKEIPMSLVPRPHTFEEIFEIAIGNPLKFCYLSASTKSTAYLQILILISGNVHPNLGPAFTADDIVSDCPAKAIHFQSANINSLHGKFHAVNAQIDAHKLGIFALQETKLSPSFATVPEFSVPGYSLF